MLFNVRKCDVYGTHGNVKTYSVAVYEIDAKTGERKEQVLAVTPDWSKRALDRAVKFINRGLQPLSQAETESNA